MTQLTPERCLALIEAIASDSYDYTYSLTNSTVGTEILQLSRVDRVMLVVSMAHWINQPSNLGRHLPQQSDTSGYLPGYRNVLAAFSKLLRQQLPFQADDLHTVLTEFLSGEIVHWLDLIGALTQAIEQYCQTTPPSPELLPLLHSVIDQVERLNYYGSAMRQYASRLKAIVQAETAALALVPGESWSDTAIQTIEAMDQTTRSHWGQLLTVCATSTGGKPSAKWLKSAQALVAQIGWPSFSQALLAWFPLVDQPRTQPIEEWQPWMPDPNLLLNDVNADILRGLVWLCAASDDGELARAIAKLAISAYRKAPGIGPRCVRLGNACVWTLGQMPGEIGLAQLAVLKVKVKFGTAQKGIETALTTAANRLGLPKAELEELSVPSYGLEAVGQRQETLGDFTAELRVTGTSTTELRWLKADGKPQKSVPKAVQEQYKEELKELKQAAKDIQTMLPAQRDRLESLYLQQKTWDLATWKSRYLDHPLVGTLARRLIWQFSEGDRVIEGIWLDHQLVNRADQLIDWLSDSTQVQLWHPITASPATILAWRTWLLEHQIQQPFKQAHREIYLLTAAEETTRTYSNRFAAHILKQHQFNALCAQRGWKNQLRLMVDDTCPPATLSLPQWGIRAEYWIDGIGDNYGVDTNATGTFLYLVTDQVRFYSIDAPGNRAQVGSSNYYTDSRTAVTPLPLETIPALVLSEVMRDVDLFVGVASVGNDPSWLDGGAEGRPYGDYWHRYSFGDLSETAQTRRQVLETLIPRLKIRDRCHFQDKYLVVRGDLRTYKIHLGSGNILMEPNDQYLCIVPSKSVEQGKVFLPFEGDGMLAIVLSKALLLAADTQIQDPSIVSQIRLL